MSATATFEFKTNLSNQEVLDALRGIWNGDKWYRVEVMSKPEMRSLLCHLSFIVGNPKEAEMLTSVINYLLTISSDKKIYYYRSFDTINETVDYHREIDQADIFTEEYKPGDYDGTQYRYLIKHN